MAILEPLRRGAVGFVDTLGEGWEWLRERGASALTRFRRIDEEGAFPSAVDGGWGLLASDVAETDDEILVRVEAPGVEESDFSVFVASGELVVRGRKHFEREAERAAYHLFESAFGSFERRFALPCKVDAERAKARYRNGVLYVRLPRSEEDRRRRVQVKAA